MNRSERKEFWVDRIMINQQKAQDNNKPGEIYSREHWENEFDKLQPPSFRERLFDWFWNLF